MKDKYRFEHIELRPWAGTHIDAAMADACSCAIEYACVVSFDFNGERYTVRPEDARGAIKLVAPKEDTAT